MSRTYKDKPFKLTEAYKYYKDNTTVLKYEDDEFIYVHKLQGKTLRAKKKKAKDTADHTLQSTPSYWVHDFMTVPMRAKSRHWDYVLSKTCIDELDTLDLPNVSHTPHVYFW
jgi:hypothetical protein